MKNTWKFTFKKPEKIMEQDCIPVRCVPPACCPFLPACTGPGGAWFRVVSAPGGGGVPASGPGGMCVSQHAMGQTPPCEQNYRHV